MWNGSLEKQDRSHKIHSIYDTQKLKISSGMEKYLHLLKCISHSPLESIIINQKKIYAKT